MEKLKSTIISTVMPILCLLFFGYGTGLLIAENIGGEKKCDGVSIQKYDNIEKRVTYLYYENAVKDQILYDLIVKHKMDSSFVLSVSKHLPLFIMNSKDKRALPDSLPDKKVLAYQIDSVCADWYESIAFMFMDAKHDSAWVLQSESYQRIMETVKPLREKK